MEQILNFPLKELYKQPGPKRARRSILRLRRILSKKFHSKEENIVISQKINEAIWAKGFSKPPKTLALKIIKEKEKIKAYLQNETIEKPVKKETKKPEKTSEETKTEKPKPKTSEQKQVAASEKKKSEKVSEQKENPEEKDPEQQKKLNEKKDLERAAARASIKKKTR